MTEETYENVLQSILAMLYPLYYTTGPTISLHNIWQHCVQPTGLAVT